MAMNRCHRWCCSSDRWTRHVEDELLPWALTGVRLGDNTLEIGPGYGAFLRVHRDRRQRDVYSGFFTLMSISAQ